MRLVGKTAFITGASTGIGYDLCNKLCRLGMNVVGCSRRIENVEVSAQTLVAALAGSFL